MSKHPLARDVLIAFTIKLLVVIAAAIFLFGPEQLPKIDAASIASRLIGAPDISPLSRNPSP